MSKIAVIKEALMICRNTNITPFVFGHRGLGKSSIVKQIAVSNGWGFIDYRASQIESSDLRGLPDRGDDNRTHYLPPMDMPSGDMSMEEIKKELGPLPKAGDYDAERLYEKKLRHLQPRFPYGILFLDELNRAADDVLQAAFQLVLDRSIGQYVLPPGWSIAAAGNFMEGYLVNGFSDPAFLNRFCHLTLSGGETTLTEWIDYTSTIYGELSTDVIEFASQNIDHLDGKVSGELGFSIQPSRRSWEMVIKVMDECRKNSYSELAKTEVIAGLIGVELARAFTSYSCPIKPRQLIEDGVKRHTNGLGKLERNQLTGLMWGMVSFCKNRINEENIANTCLDFAEFMVHHIKEQDLVVAFCRSFVTGKSSTEESESAAMISNPKLAKMLAAFEKKSNKTTKSFLERLVDRPELHKAISAVAWGTED